MAINRRFNEKIYDSTYEIVRNDFCCVYCGKAGTGLDHVPPISKIAAYRALKLDYEEYLKITCCSECNSILSNSLQSSFYMRIRMAKIKLAKRHEKKLFGQSWTESKIRKELKGWLAGYVRKANKEKSEIVKRIEYSEGYRLCFKRMLENQHEKLNAIIDDAILFDDFMSHRGKSIPEGLIRENTHET